MGDVELERRAWYYANANPNLGVPGTLAWAAFMAGFVDGSRDQAARDRAAVERLVKAAQVALIEIESIRTYRPDVHVSSDELLRAALAALRPGTEGE